MLNSTVIFVDNMVKYKNSYSLVERESLPYAGHLDSHQRFGSFGVSDSNYYLTGVTGGLA